MAGQAEKKNKARAEQLTKYYFFAVAIINSIYISYKVLPQWSAFDAYNVLGFILFSVVSYFTYNSIISSLKLGVPADSSNDLFIINLTTQFLVTFTAYGWYLYLTVPAYVLYKGGMFVREYLLSRSGGEEEDTESEEQQRKREKREAKRERHMQQPKYRVMRK